VLLSTKNKIRNKENNRELIFFKLSVKTNYLQGIKNKILFKKKMMKIEKMFILLRILRINLSLIKIRKNGVFIIIPIIKKIIYFKEILTLKVICLNKNFIYHNKIHQDSQK
jgi:hypothetical protein